MTRIGRSPLRKGLAAGLTLILVLAAACGDDSSTAPAPDIAESTTSTAAPETTTTTVPEVTTTTAAPATGPRRLSYSYPTTGEIEYSVSIEQQAEVQLEGGPAEEAPLGAMEMTSILAGTISYRTSPGPEEGTVSIRIVSDLDLVENEATMGGFTIPSSELDGAPGFEAPIDITVVVDQQGNVLDFSSAALDDLFGSGDFPGAGSIGNEHFNRPFGPAFPDAPLGVGDSWTERIEQEGPGGMLVTNAEHRVVAVEGAEERPILVVESEYQTEAFEWDMSEMMSGIFEAFTEESQEVLPELQLPEFQLLITAAPGSVQSTVWFDPELGLVVQGQQQASGEATTQMTMPDETGEPFTIVTGVKYDQGMSYHLISPAT